MKVLSKIGRYFLMLKSIFGKLTKWKILKQLILKDIDTLIIGSLGIVSFIYFFVGGVVSIQTALNLENQLLPKNLIGFATRQSVILEFAPTFCSIILAGKVGSYITSSIGSMRVTEQIDALEVMGINSINHLVLPKVLATVFFYPFLIVLAMFLGIFGGWVAGFTSSMFSEIDYMQGLQLDFNPFLVQYALIKTLIFAFLIATVPSYHGYYVKGGSIAVGKASTQAVVWTIILIVITNYFLTQLLLT